MKKLRLKKTKEQAVEATETMPAETPDKAEAAVEEGTESESREAAAEEGTESESRDAAVEEGTESEPLQMPPLEELENELVREQYKFRYLRALRNTVFTLITVAAAAVLIAVLWMPVLQIYGSSMSPQLVQGDIVLSRKTSNFKVGDVVAFYYNNKVLVKRMIGNPGDWIDIDADGNVYVNGELIDEPYVSEKSLGDCDIDLPYQVPESKYFVMGDHRSVSIDSRNTSIGCVEEDQIVGKLMITVWPLNDLGIVR